MKTIRKTILVLTILTCYAVTSQESSGRKRAKEKKVTEKIDRASDKVNNVNKTINASTDSITTTVEDTKRTLKELKTTIFGEKKNRKKTEKNIEFVTVDISNIAYSNENAIKLQDQLTKIKGVKKVSKRFVNQNITFTVDSKESADLLWEQISSELQKAFIIKEMGDKNILLSLN